MLLRHLRRTLALLADQYASLRHLSDRRVALLAGVGLLDVMSVSLIVPLLPAYAESLGAGPFVLGVLFALPTAARALLSVPFGYVADRLDRRALVAAGTILGAVSVAALGLISSLAALLWLRALDGVGRAMAGPSSTAYLGDLADDDSRAGVLGAHRTARLLGVAFGPALGGLLAATFSLATPFVVLGGATLLGGVALALFLPSVARETPNGRDDGSDDTSNSSLQDTSLAELRRIAGPSVATLALSALVSNVGTNALNPLLALLLATTVDASPAYVGGAWSAFGVAMAVCLPIGGTLGDRFERKRLVVVGKAGWVVVTVGLVAFESRLAPPLCLALGGIASALAGPAIGALYYETAPDGKEGTALGVYSTLGAVGGSAGPLAGGAVASAFGVRTAVLCIGALWLFDTVLVGVGVRPSSSESGGEVETEREGGDDDATTGDDATTPHPN